MNKLSRNTAQALIVLAMASPITLLHAGGPHGSSSRFSGNQGGAGNFNKSSMMNKTPMLQQRNFSVNNQNLGGNLLNKNLNVNNSTFGNKASGISLGNRTGNPISIGGKLPVTQLPGNFHPLPGTIKPNPGTPNPGTVSPFPGGFPSKGPIVSGPFNPLPGTVNPNPGNNNPPGNNPPGNNPPGNNPPGNNQPGNNQPGHGNCGNGHCYPLYPCWRPWIGCFGTFRCPTTVQPVYLPVVIQTTPDTVTQSQNRNVDLSIVSATIVEPAGTSQGALVRLQILNKGPMSLDLPARVAVFGAEMNQTSGDMPNAKGEMKSMAVGETSTMELRMPVESINKPVLIVAIEMPEGYRDLNEQDNVAMGEMAKLPVATVASR